MQETEDRGASLTALCNQKHPDCGKTSRSNGLHFSMNKVLRKERDEGVKPIDYNRVKRYNINKMIVSRK